MKAQKTFSYYTADKLLIVAVTAPDIIIADKVFSEATKLDPTQNGIQCAIATLSQYNHWL